MRTRQEVEICEKLIDLGALTSIPEHSRFFNYTKTIQFIRERENEILKLQSENGRLKSDIRYHESNVKAHVRVLEQLSTVNDSYREMKNKFDSMFVDVKSLLSTQNIQVNTYEFIAKLLAKYRYK